MTKNETKIIRASAELQQKVGIGSIDESKIALAQAIIDSNTVDFEPLARPLLDQLDKAVQRARQGVGNQASLLDSITLPVMQLKGNASTFNYPLVSDMTGTVLNFLEHVGRVDDEILDIVENLHKAVTVAVLQKLSGKDSKAGAVLAQEFRDVCKRYLDKRAG